MLFYPMNTLAERRSDKSFSKVTTDGRN